MSRAAQPRFVAPMLLTAGEPPEDAAFVLEQKHDGWRMQARWDGRELCLRSRPGRDCTEEFPQLLALGRALGSRRVILDCELVCLRPDGRPDFALLRPRIADRRSGTLMLQIFDLLWLDDRPAVDLPYVERRALLEDLELDGPVWRTPPTVSATDTRFVDRLRELNLEGVVAKRLDSPYRPGVRSAAWIKHKFRREEHLALTGIRRSPEGRAEALLVARSTVRGLQPAGAIEIGLRAPIVAEIEQRLESLPGRERGRTTWYPPEVWVTASLHGLEDGAVRDAVLLAVHVAPDGSSGPPGGECRVPTA